MNTILKKNDLWEDIGEVKYKHSKKAKYIRIVINHNSQVSVVIPNHYNIKDAIEFVHSKKNWIQKNKIRIIKKKKLIMKLSNVELEKFWDDTKQKMVQLANIHQLDFYKLTFKTLKTKWGSCSQNNTICINNIIYYLPEHLKEYIMLHELTHTKIKNHSRIFWEELEKICSNSKLKRKELRNNYAIE
ncbi:MAG: YgjP-like metallopeptidase domain-containing protein [Candidatus Neomarinimicrobiota bacterium]